MILGLRHLPTSSGGSLHRDLAGIPLNVILQYIVPLLAIPLVDCVQVREAATIPLRFRRMAHQAADLLRHWNEILNRPWCYLKEDQPECL